jgi:hypothetical protein
MLSERRIWGEVPAGFKEIKSARARLIVRQDRVGVLDLATCRQAEVCGISTGFKGRKSLGAVKLETGETVLIRPYHHGGILRAVTRRVFFSWPPRPFQELAITEELRRRGVPTVEPYGACVERLRGPFYRGWLLTRQLEEAHDLWAALQNGFVGRLGSEQVLRAAARSVRSMHTEGVYHTDLNLKNILVREEGGGVRGRGRPRVCHRFR